MTIKPAIPLPWSVQGDPCHYGTLSDIIDGSGTKFAQTFSEGLSLEQDAAYIVHACNNYPKLQEQNAKLVEALEQILDATEDEGLEDVLSISFLKGMHVAARSALTSIKEGEE